MIEFIEKEPWYNDNSFTGHCYIYPNYMLKYGKEFFVCNRREPDDKWKVDEINGYKKQLMSTDGAYFRFNSFYENPFEMIREIASRGHHFVEPKNLYRYSMEKDGFIDFHGNRKEVSAAFSYRIYDMNIANAIKKAVELLKKEKWMECKCFVADYL